jgi:hypothetical protein
MKGTVFVVHKCIEIYMLCKHFGDMQLSLQGREGIGSASLLEALVLKEWQ